MISTTNIAAAQQGDNVFTLESSLPEPQEVVLIVGSCRCVAFLNYFDRYNRTAGHPFRIHFIEPFQYPPEKLIALETSEHLLSILRRTTIFVHEHFGNYGMFNTSRDAEKNIYQFGMGALQITGFELADISIPNFHDRFILENDWAACGLTAPEHYWQLGRESLEQFYELCQWTDFPEMARYFKDNWRTKRFFWRPNHTSAEFTLWIFRQMNARFLHLPLDDAFWNGAAQEDLFKEPHTEVTQRDIENYGLEWR